MSWNVRKCYLGKKNTPGKIHPADMVQSEKNCHTTVLFFFPLETVLNFYMAVTVFASVIIIFIVASDQQT